MKDEDKDQFNTSITINDMEVKVHFEKLVALDVLALAVEQGVIGTKPENYVLESKNPPHTFKHEEWVNFLEYKEFTAEMSAPTPVAIHIESNE